MRNFLSLCLFLAPAGLVHATIVYASATVDVSTISIDHQLDGTHEGSSYALDVSLMNFEYISGNYTPNTGPFLSPFSLEGQEAASEGAKHTSANLPLDPPAMIQAQKADTGMFGIAGAALICLGWIRRPRTTQGQV